MSLTTGTYDAKPHEHLMGQGWWGRANPNIVIQGARDLQGRADSLTGLKSFNEPDKIGFTRDLGQLRFVQRLSSVTPGLQRGNLLQLLLGLPTQK